MSNNNITRCFTEGESVEPASAQPGDCSQRTGVHYLGDGYKYYVCMTIGGSNFM